MPQVTGEEFIKEIAKHKIYKIVSTKWFYEKSVFKTERDDVAIEAMKAMIISGKWPITAGSILNSSHDMLAIDAYRMADAMIKESNKKE